MKSNFLFPLNTSTSTLDFCSSLDFFFACLFPFLFVLIFFLFFSWYSLVYKNLFIYFYSTLLSYFFFHFFFTIFVSLFCFLCLIPQLALCFGLILSFGVFCFSFNWWILFLVSYTCRVTPLYLVFTGLFGFGFVCVCVSVCSFVLFLLVLFCIYHLSGVHLFF